MRSSAGYIHQCRAQLRALQLRGQSPHKYGNSRSGWMQADLAEEMNAAAAHVFRLPSNAHPESFGLRKQPPWEVGPSPSGCMQEDSLPGTRGAIFGFRGQSPHK
mmetsp:Transcript_35507/g.53095  ORF Transcript_35507/g.53095 Transcript_35507/m.53095 type:complete len:104 (+) Transcript_35507:168-479(+)